MKNRSRRAVTFTFRKPSSLAIRLSALPPPTCLPPLYHFISPPLLLSPWWGVVGRTQSSISPLALLALPAQHLLEDGAINGIQGRAAEVQQAAGGVRSSVWLAAIHPTSLAVNKQSRSPSELN